MLSHLIPVKARVLSMAFVVPRDLHSGPHLSDLHSSLGSRDYAGRAPPGPLCRVSLHLPFQGLGRSSAQRAAGFAPLHLQVLCSHVTSSVKPFLIIFASPFCRNTPYPSGQPQVCFFFPLSTFHILTNCLLSSFIFCLLLDTMPLCFLHCRISST